MTQNQTKSSPVEPRGFIFAIILHDTLHDVAIVTTKNGAKADARLPLRCTFRFSSILNVIESGVGLWLAWGTAVAFILQA